MPPPSALGMGAEAATTVVRTGARVAALRTASRVSAILLHTNAPHASRMASACRSSSRSLVSANHPACSARHLHGSSAALSSRPQELSSRLPSRTMALSCSYSAHAFSTSAATSCATAPAWPVRAGSRAYGMPNFATLRERGAFFADHSRFLPLLDELHQVVFLRPPRFGKTLWLSVMEHYYDVRFKE